MVGRISGSSPLGWPGDGSPRFGLAALKCILLEPQPIGNVQVRRWEAAQRAILRFLHMIAVCYLIPFG